MNDITTTTTTRPIVELVKKLSDVSESCKDNASFPQKLGHLQGLLLCFAIDLDVHSEDGSIQRDKIIDLLEKLIQEANA